MIKMCKYGTTVNIEVTIPEYIFSSGDIKPAHKKICPIDSCIVSIVEALEDHNILMTASCCGHGKMNGRISLQDGRELIIKRD